MNLELVSLQRAEAAYQKAARQTARLFYGLGEQLVMEVILHSPRRGSASIDGATHPTLQLDENIAARLNFNPKEVRQFLANLQADRLVVSKRVDIDKSRSGADALLGIRDASQQAAPGADSIRLFWGIHYETFVDAVRFKLNAMGRALEEEERGVDMKQEYRCNKCNRTIDALEISPAMLGDDGETLHCDVCMSELEEVDNSEQTSGIETRRKLMRAELRDLLMALDEADEFEPPRFLYPVTEQTNEALTANSMRLSKSAGASTNACSTSSASAEQGGSILGGSRYGGPKQEQSTAAPAIVPWMMSEAQIAAAAEAAANAHEDGSANAPALDEGRTEAWMQAFMASKKRPRAEAANAPQKRAANAGRETGLPVSAEVFDERPHELAIASNGTAGAVDERSGFEQDLAHLDASANGQEEEEDEDDEITVTVQGVPVALSSITEEDQERMTPAEHEQFLQIYHDETGAW
mmetsp:Transcript_4489/g.9736  ORF Transcript_4489/g.9736 Transcript_4489/m.9736 type:complete len:467 (-) Transcript_4489:384-1784(-)